MEALLQVHFDGFIPGTSRSGFLAFIFEAPVGSQLPGSWSRHQSHSFHRATPPSSPASFETISMFLPGLKSIFLALPPPR